MTTQFQLKINLVNLYVLNRRGKITARCSGPVNPDALHELIRAIGEADARHPER